MHRRRTHKYVTPNVVHNAKNRLGPLPCDFSFFISRFHCLVVKDKAVRFFRFYAFYRLNNKFYESVISIKRSVIYIKKKCYIYKKGVLSIKKCSIYKKVLYL